MSLPGDYRVDRLQVYTQQCVEPSSTNRPLYLFSVFHYAQSPSPFRLVGTTKDLINVQFVFIL